MGMKMGDSIVTATHKVRIMLGVIHPILFLES